MCGHVKKSNPLLYKAIDKATSKLWSSLNTAYSGIKNPLITSVGSVPYVGGILAATVSTVLDQVYAAAQNGINNALYKLSDKVSMLITKSIVKVAVKAIVKAGTLDVNAMAKASKSAIKDEQKRRVKKGKKKLASAERKAKNASKNIKKLAEDESREMAKDEKEMASAETEAATG